MYRKGIIIFLLIANSWCLKSQEFVFSTESNLFQYSPINFYPEKAVLCLNIFADVPLKNLIIEFDTNNPSNFIQYNHETHKNITFVTVIKHNEDFILLSNDNSDNETVVQVFNFDGQNYALKQTLQPTKDCYAINMIASDNHLFVLVMRGVWPFSPFETLYKLDINNFQILDSIDIIYPGRVVKMEFVKENLMIFEKTRFISFDTATLNTTGVIEINNHILGADSWQVVDSTIYWIGEYYDSFIINDPNGNMQITFYSTDFFGNRTDSIDAADSVFNRRPSATFGKQEYDDNLLKDASWYDKTDDAFYIASASSIDNGGVKALYPRDILLIKSDREKKNYWYKYFFEDGAGYTPSGIFTTKDYIYVLTHYNDPSDRNIPMEIHLYKFDKEGNLVSSIDSPKGLKPVLKTYPNPANSIINFDGLGPAVYQLKIYNIKGQLVFNEQINGFSGSTYQISIGNKPPGLYFYKAYNKKEQFTGKIMLTK